MKNEKKTCPLLSIATETANHPCIEKSCAWFTRDICAVADIANSQAEVASNSSFFD